jgi:hypothetical protein
VGRRRGHDIVPTGAQISREGGSLVQRVLRVLRSTERLVLARSEGDWRADTRRGSDEVVEEEGAVSTADITRQSESERVMSAWKWDAHQQPETSDLQHGIRPDKNLPTEPKTNDPDRDSPTRVSDTPRSGGDVPGDAETEEVEEADGERDGDGRTKDAWVGNGLVPSAREIEER